MCRSLFVILIRAGAFAVASVSMQNFYWRDYLHGEIPFDALEAAPGVYIGQVCFEEGPYVATIYPHRNNAIAMHYLYQEVTQNIKIFCTPEPEKFYWEKVDYTKGGARQMRNAVRGGYQQPRWIQYIGRVMHLNNWKIGKAYDIEDPSEPGMYVWGPDGSRVILLQFELLKYNASATAHACSLERY